MTEQNNTNIDTKIYLLTEAHHFYDERYIDSAIGNNSGHRYIALEGHVISSYGEIVTKYSIQEDSQGEYIKASELKAINDSKERWCEI